MGFFNEFLKSVTKNQRNNKIERDKDNLIYLEEMSYSNQIADILDEYIKHVDDVENVGSTNHPIPKFNKEAVIDLCRDAKKILLEQERVLMIKGETYVVGDIHGNFHDLVRIIKNCGPPKRTQYLFLGDYVDRGELSTETMILLLAYMVRFPYNFFLLRGNHESREINKEYGFYEEIKNYYHCEEIYEAFNEVFEYLPVAAVVNNTSFCVHGGISRHVESLNDITRMNFLKPTQRSVVSIVLEDFLWSDPYQNVEGYELSDRGHGSKFGSYAVDCFLATNSLKRIVRAHEFIRDGILEMWGGKCITVFSSSCYLKEQTPLGVLLIHQNGRTSKIILPPGVVTSRYGLLFKDYKLIQKLQLLTLNYPNPSTQGSPSVRLTDRSVAKRRKKWLNLPIGETTVMRKRFTTPIPKIPSINKNKKGPGGVSLPAIKPLKNISAC